MSSIRSKRKSAGEGCRRWKVVCSGVGTAVGRGGRPTLPINLRLSREDCSQGKYSLHPVTQGRLLILPGRYLRAHRQRMRTVLFTDP